jgi:hypothetical protein
VVCRVMRVIMCGCMMCVVLAGICDNNVGSMDGKCGGSVVAYVLKPDKEHT